MHQSRVASPLVFVTVLLCSILTRPALGGCEEDASAMHTKGQLSMVMARDGFVKEVCKPGVQEDGKRAAGWVEYAKKIAKYNRDNMIKSHLIHTTIKKQSAIISNQLAVLVKCAPSTSNLAKCLYIRRDLNNNLSRFNAQLESLKVLTADFPPNLGSALLKVLDTQRDALAQVSSAGR